MTATIRTLQALSLAASLVVGTAAQAAFVTFTSQAAFDAATTARGLDTFTGLSVTSTTFSPLERNAGSYTYRASVPGDFFAGGSTADPFLSSNIATDVILLNAFTPGITAIAGRFFTSNLAGAAAPGGILLTAVDTEGSVSQTLLNTSVDTYFGFRSTTSLVSLSVASIQPTTGFGFLWPSLDDLTLGRTAATTVPEPTTLALAALGLLAAAGLRRRA